MNWRHAMIEILSARSTPTCVVSRWGDTLRAEDFVALDAAVDAALEAAGKEGKASAVFVFESMPFPGNWDALKSDASFVRHEYSQLACVAYVGDVKWIDFKIKALGWTTRPDDRTFAATELDAAIAWACGGAD
jgi:hypothetical protein